MKYAVIILLGISTLFPRIVSADANGTTYSVQAGDTLWEISSKELGNPWCWPLIAAKPENHLDFQGTLFAGTSITLPSAEECDDILHPVVADSMHVETSGYLFDQPWNAQLRTVNAFLDARFGTTSGLERYSKYDDMFEPNDASLYRERDGAIWYVVSNGTRGRAWDYVDHVLRNDATGSVFYRARDVDGAWYLIKNETATKLSFEPNNVGLILAFDEAIAYRSGDGSTQAYSSLESWTIPVESMPEAVDPTGRVLFVSWQSVPVQTVDGSGATMTVCSSSVCSNDQVYWLDGERIATSGGRMVPQFSDHAAAAPLPFFYEGSQKAFKYYGVFGRPSFDADGNLVLRSLFDVRLTTVTVSLQ